VPAFGGRPGGRPSKFRFPAGTERGDEERRKADADRKAALRARAARLAEPPPLPSANAPAVDPSPTPNGDQSFVAPVEVGRPVVPWTAEMLQELTDGIVDALEERRVEKFTEKAKEAQLPEKLVKEIGTDARYPVVGKRGLKVALPQVGAKLANKAGISAEHLPEVILAKAITLNVVHGRRLEAKLDKLIEQEKARQKEEQKK
jgi:hypothetical protein